MKYCTLAQHALHPHKSDVIYTMNQAAATAASTYGQSQVINATLGNCIDDDDKIMILPTVDRLMRNMELDELYSYAPITGLPGFEFAVTKSLFGDWNPPYCISAIPTPGGTGALRNLVWNFLDEGEPLLTSDWCWNPYQNICLEHNRTFETFHLFDEDGNFNLLSFEESISRLISRNHHVVVLINTPGHNPTGYRISSEEMKQVSDIIRNCTSTEDKKVTVCLDLAYIDYNRKEGEARELLSCFDNLPENMMLTAIFSMSKSYTMPGLRCGALVAFARTRGVAEEFQNTMSFSARSVWSNAIRCAQRIVIDICSDSSLYDEVANERNFFAQRIVQRGKEFRKIVESSQIPVCKYSSGFFVSIPCKAPDQLTMALQEKNIFVVPLKQGIRFSVCSTNTKKCIQAAEMISETYHMCFG